MRLSLTLSSIFGDDGASDATRNRYPRCRLSCLRATYHVLNCLVRESLGHRTGDLVLHLLGLGVLLFGSSVLSRVLGGLVIPAGAGYRFDSMGELLVLGYAVSLAVFTFVAEVLLIVWLV